MQRAGQIIGERYRLEELLERGAMGSVWRAEQVRLRAPAAIKFLDPSLIGDPEMLERFIQEARSAAALRSVNVVQIFDYGSDGNAPYIAMELLEGEDLGARLSSRGTLTPSELNKIFGEVARGIGQAHAMGVVHRDVKPGNIFIAREGEHEVTKLIDFGIAKVKADALKFTQVVGTKLGTLLGTPQYMSPEQVRGSSTVDHRTDLWALAIIACECLTGRYPFPGTSIGDLSVQICTERPLAPSTLGQVPSGFDQWFFKGTSKKPSGRFASVEEMADALEKILLAPGASSSSSAASGWLVGLRERAQVRRLWDVARSGLNPISAVVRRNVSGMGHALSTFAPMLRTERFARAIQRLTVQRLLGARSAWIVPALLIVVCGIVLVWSRQRREPTPASQHREPSTAVRAASPAPVAAEAVSQKLAETSEPPPAPAPALEAREDDTPPSAAAEGSEPAPAPALRRPRKTGTPSPSATQTPFGKMSVAMGQAGARIARGDTQRDAARVTPAAAAKLRAPAAKAAKGAPVAPVESSPRQP
jgi:eukaryotic-like serine/threonine-protein kinase